MKEYKTIKEILDDLINREIGKSEAEEAILKFKVPTMLTMSVNSVRSIMSSWKNTQQTMIVLETDINFEDAEIIFKKGLKVDVTKSKS